MATTPKVPADLSRMSDTALEKLWNDLAVIRLRLREDHKLVIAERDKRLEAARAAERVAQLSDPERRALLQELQTVGIPKAEDAT